jgi:hypothetical protein
MYKPDVFNTITESEIQLPTNLKVVSINNAPTNPSNKAPTNASYSATSNYNDSIINKSNAFSATSINSMAGGGLLSATSTMIGGNKAALSATSVAMIGGNGQAPNPANYTNDINKLLSMLTSESEQNTSTQNLENQLSNILKKDPHQKGGNNPVSVGQIKGFFNDLKSQGIDVNVKLNDQTMSEFFNGAENTTTDLNNDIFVNNENQVGGGKKRSRKASKKSSKKASLKGGKKASRKASRKASKKASKKVSKKSSRKGSRKGSKKGSMDGGKGSNPGFQAFLDLKKHIAEALSIPNGPGAGKIASVVRNDVKEKDPNLNAVDLSKKAMKHFDENKEKYKKLV